MNNSSRTKIFHFLTDLFLILIGTMKLSFSESKYMVKDTNNGKDYEFEESGVKW